MSELKPGMYWVRHIDHPDDPVAVPHDGRKWYSVDFQKQVEEVICYIPEPDEMAERDEKLVASAIRDFARKLNDVPGDTARLDLTKTSVEAFIQNWTQQNIPR